MIDGEETNFSCRRLPNELYRYSALNGGEQKSLVLPCGPSLQRLQQGKAAKKTNLTVENLTCSPSQVTQVNINSDKLCRLCVPSIRCNEDGILPL